MFSLISIHALREEGDRVYTPESIKGAKISIHALREEGDAANAEILVVDDVFLSTPSARRATLQKPSDLGFSDISIHALREEGDACRSCH